MEDCILMCLKRADYEELNNSIPKMNVLSRKLTERFLVMNESQYRSLLRDEPEVRLKNMIKEEPQMISRVPPVSWQYIASYLDIPLLQLTRMV